MNVVTDSLATIEAKIISQFPAVVIDTEGVAYPVKFTAPKPSLAELQAIVGGLIQIIPLGDYCGREMLMVMNEEGKLNSLPLNRRATRIAQGNVAIFEGDSVVGDALVIERTLMEDDADEDDPEADTTDPSTA